MTQENETQEKPDDADQTENSSGKVIIPQSERQQSVATPDDPQQHETDEHQTDKSDTDKETST